MRRLILLLLALAMVIASSGCGVAMQSQSRAANEKLMQLQVGMDRQQVLSLMGNPHRREMYGETEFLIYETNHWADSEKERFTPILLNKGKIAGWGRNYYDDAIRSKIEADVRVKSQ